MQIVFITGAEGFAGSYLTQYLKQRGYEVVAGVRNRARKLAFERQHGKALVCDVSDAINVARAVASVKPDVIIHLAGTSRPAEAGEEPLAAYQSIVTAWANVLDAARRAVPRAKLLLVSACDVYGIAGSDGRKLSETTALQPVTTFGSLKAAAEKIAETFFRNYHLNVTIARPFHYTGAGQSDLFYFASAAQRIATCDASLGCELRLRDLAAGRDVMHVEDVVAAYERLIQEGKPNETYNICTGQTHACGEIVQMIARECGVSVQLKEQPPAEDEVPMPMLCGDNSKICAQLNWRPTRSIADAVRDLVRGVRQRAPVSAAAAS